MGKPLIYNRLIIFLALIIFLQIGTMSSCGLTDLDYSLRKLKYSVGSTSTEQSFHGENSAKLSVNGKDHSAKIYIYMDDSLLFQDLDEFSMWVLPQSESGMLQLELYLDGNEDGKYNSNSQDAKILSLKKNWTEMNIGDSQWNELDGFDLEYEGSESLDDLKDRLKDKRIIQIYITVYNDKTDGIETTFIDCIKIGGEIISFEPLEEEEIKDGPSSASPGGLMTYTITYGNNELKATDLTVKEYYDPRTVFIESYPPPDPGTTDTWTFPKLPPGAHGQIIVKMRSVKPAARASIDGHVSGRGFAATKGLLSTEAEGFLVTNNVHITGGEFNFSASATTRIRPIVGSTLAYAEHGSGEYQADETLTYSPASISARRSILAARSSESAGFSDVAANPPQGDWSAFLRSENDYRDIRWSDRYYEAKNLNLSYKAQLGKTLSYLETSAQVLGLADRTATWPGGFADSRLAGNFSLAGKARWRVANRTVSPEKEWLECCPLVQGD